MRSPATLESPRSACNFYFVKEGNKGWIISVGSSFLAPMSKESESTGQLHYLNQEEHE